MTTQYLYVAELDVERILAIICCLLRLKVSNMVTPFWPRTGRNLKSWETYPNLPAITEPIIQVESLAESLNQLTKKCDKSPNVYTFLIHNLLLTASVFCKRKDREREREKKIGHHKLLRLLIS